jgi:hypothetical protein
MVLITENRFRVICSGIRDDREIILKHNPIGTPDETLLWMLLGCLTVYFGLTDAETPCFTGTPDAKAYRDAINFVLQKRREDSFDAERYIDEMLA